MPAYDTWVEEVEAAVDDPDKLVDLINRIEADKSLDDEARESLEARAGRYLYGDNNG